MPKVVGTSGGGMFRLPGVEQIGDMARPLLAGVVVQRSRANQLFIGVRMRTLLQGIDRDLADSETERPE